MRRVDQYTGAATAEADELEAYSRDTWFTGHICLHNLGTTRWHLLGTGRGAFAEPGAGYRSVMRSWRIRTGLRPRAEDCGLHTVAQVERAPPAFPGVD